MATDETPRIPRAAFICGLAALAFTTGITVALIPSLRTRRPPQGTQFLSNTSLARGSVGRGRIPNAGRMPARTEYGTPMDSPPPSVSLRSGSGSGALSILDDPHPSLHPVHPADPVPQSAAGDADSGPGDGGISPLFALGAFGIATGLVCATAGVTAWGVARVLDVRDMEEFTAKMRHYTTRILPDMSGNLYRPPSTLPVEQELPPPQDEEDGIVREWVRDIVAEMEEDRARLVESRGLQGGGTR